VTVERSALRAARLEAGEPLRVWYGVVAGPTAWLVQASVYWLVSGRACADGTLAWGPLAPSAVRVLLIVIAAAALAAGWLALATSARIWRAISERASLSEAEGYGVAEYVALAGVLLSGVFLLAMVGTTLPVFIVDLCEVAR
jgi:hypothetical protein